jgi:glutamate dehydrogenase/leucine dehydrogenase
LSTNRNEGDYIFGPDMGTDETCMAWIKDEIGRSVGLPAALGGIPLDEVGATGWGLYHAAEVIGEANVDRLRAKLVLQGANIPFTEDAERRLHSRQVLVLPDFLVNAGGVICAAFEYRGATHAAAFEAIAERIRANTQAVLAAAAARGIAPRAAAQALAVERVRSAMQTRRFSVY